MFVYCSTVFLIYFPFMIPRTILFNPYQAPSLFLNEFPFNRCLSLLFFDRSVLVRTPEFSPEIFFLGKHSSSRENNQHRFFIQDLSYKAFYHFTQLTPLLKKVESVESYVFTSFDYKICFCRHFNSSKTLIKIAVN
jgi:hypothetical protein